MATPEFLQFTCIGNDLSECATCPKDFTIPVDSIEGIYKDMDGKALVLILDTHYCPYPLCGDKLRFIQTSLTYEDMIILLNGKIHVVGDIKLIYQDRITKR